MWRIKINAFAEVWKTSWLWMGWRRWTAARTGFTMKWMAKVMPIARQLQVTTWITIAIVSAISIFISISISFCLLFSLLLTSSNQLLIKALCNHTRQWYAKIMRQDNKILWRPLFVEVIFLIPWVSITLKQVSLRSLASKLVFKASWRLILKS